MFRFLPGLLLIQLVTVGLVLICLKWSHDSQFVIVAVASGVLAAFLTTFWFGSIVRNIQNSSQAKLKARHAKDREKIIRGAAREKAQAASASYQQIEKATKKANAKANFKVGAYFAVAIGAGGIMILSQLVTVGMMVLVASGSALAGYLIRVRQDRLSRKKQLTLPKDLKTPKKQITAPKKPLPEDDKRKRHK